MDDDADSNPRRIKSVQTASDVLAAIHRLSEPTFGAICDEVDATKGTVHTYLATLADEDFVTKAGDEYRLSFRFVTMGESVRNETELYRAGREEVDDLAERTSEYVHLTVEYDQREVTLYESRGEDGVAMDYHLQLRETPQYLHYSSSGKAMLAHFEESRVRDIVDEQGLVRQTENTLTDTDELFAELETIRERGYAVNDEEEIRGMRSVGVPIRGIDGDVCGAVSVTGPAARLTGERFESELPDLVMQTANLIEVNLETAAFDR